MVIVARYWEMINDFLRYYFNKTVIRAAPTPKTLGQFKKNFFIWDHEIWKLWSYREHRGAISDLTMQKFMRRIWSCRRVLMVAIWLILLLIINENTKITPLHRKSNIGQHWSLTLQFFFVRNSPHHYHPIESPGSSIFLVWFKNAQLHEFGNSFNRRPLVYCFILGRNKQF